MRSLISPERRMQLSIRSAVQSKIAEGYSVVERNPEIVMGLGVIRIVVESCNGKAIIKKGSYYG